MRQAEWTVPLPDGLRWQLLSVDDHERVMALHLASLQDVSADVVRQEEPCFFRSILDGRGEIAGVVSDAGLVAYTVLQRVLDDHDDPAPEWTPDPARPIAKLAGSGVLQAWRGRGLQRAFIEQRVRMAGPGTQLFATAAPANLPSWRNLLSCGFSIRAIKRLYGGHPRLIAVRTDNTGPFEATNPSADDALGFLEVDSRDIELQKLLLLQGYRGVAPAHVRGHIRYRPSRSAGAAGEVQ